MQYWISIALACLAIIASLNPATAQQNPFQVAGEAFIDREGCLDYVAPLRALASSQPSFDSDMYSQASETYNSFVGRLTPTVPIRSATPYALAEVGPLLVERARATSVVLINEAHNQPAHRAYCRQVLQQLAPLGYTLFAVEALYPTDTAINARKFPLSTSGFYTREPNMGKLLRAACESGFYVFGHEITAAQEKDFTDSRRRNNFRDSMQAVNMLAMLRKNPKAKLVALVGYDHVLEKERDGIRRLATYLRELGGLDPLTIDQTEAYEPDPARPANKPMALVTKEGRLATIGNRQGYVDMQIMHPNPTQMQGRPSWLFTSTQAQPHTSSIPKPFVGQPCLAQLYDQKEYQQYGEKAIPLDQYLTNSAQQQVHLFGFGAGRAVVVKYRLASSF